MPANTKGLAAVRNCTFCARRGKQRWFNVSDMCNAVNYFGEKVSNTWGMNGGGERKPQTLGPCQYYLPSKCKTNYNESFDYLDIAHIL